MKCLTVYYNQGKWYGQEVNWKRSGSGFYREISGIEVPQSQTEIKQFAKQNNYSIEWRGLIPQEQVQEPSTAT